MKCEIYASCSQTNGVKSKIDLISYDKIGTKYIFFIQNFAKSCKNLTQQCKN